MRYVSIVVSALVLISSPAAASEPLMPRPLDALAAETFELARAQSAVVRSLVATLESSNVIVHIVSSRDLPAGVGGITQFVTSRAGYRYVRITIAATLTKSGRAAILGHELQHACEVAASNADDVESLKRVFEKDGYRAGDFFETFGAIKLEVLIRAELRGRTVTANGALTGK
jgi:hypothetical protein